MALFTLDTQAQIDKVVASVLAVIVLVLAYRGAMHAETHSSIAAVPVAMLCASLIVGVSIVLSRR